MIGTQLMNVQFQPHQDLWMTGMVLSPEAEPFKEDNAKRQPTVFRHRSDITRRLNKEGLDNAGVVLDVSDDPRPSNGHTLNQTK